MNFKKFLILLSFIMVMLLCMSFVSAIEDNDNLTESSSILKLETSENIDDVSVSNEELLSAPQTIVVDEIEENHYEMGSSGTIQNAITNAKAGDTILINGRSYIHCHFVVNKQLTIISNVGTTMKVCPSNSEGSGHYGIFYISPEASGTVIQGITLISEVSGSEDYGILVSGASNVVIKDCKVSNDGYSDAIRIENSKNTIIDNTIVSNAENGIRIKNSDSITVKNSNIQNSNYGIYDVDSTKSTVTSNNIMNNKIGIGVAGSSNNPTISYNNITTNENGISLTSSETINILSNYIAINTNHGVYVNCKIKKINIIGNFFYKNKHEEVFNDVNTKGLYVQGGEELEVVNNNYFVGLDNRPVQRADSVGSGVFLGYAFELNTNVACPIIYSTYNVQWTVNNYRLQLSEITQSKKGIYSISIVDANGNVAKGLSSVPVTFYLNKNNNFAAPQEGDVYKTVMMVDGTATVRFYPQDFKESGNIVTAVLPGTGDYLTSDQNKNVKKFNVDDNYIPGEITASKFIISDLSTYPNSNVDYTITLLDIYNNPIVNEPVAVNINSKVFNVVTNSKGQATIKVNQNTGTYSIKATYAGDDIDYAKTSAQATLKVNKISTKIAASNFAMFIKKSTYYKVTLKDSMGNPVSKQKVTIKVNKKTYKVKTNSKGVAKLKLKLKKGKYTVKIKYAGSSKYLSAKKTAKITVKKTLKTKLVAPKITTTPKTSTKYTVTLKDENGNAIKKQKVIVKVNGKKYTKKTNSKGQASINVKFSKLKSYKVTATFKATKKFKKSSKTGKITVKKMNTVITAPNIETIPNTQNDYTVTLKAGNGKAIAKQSLKITLNGQTYNIKTNSNGQATIQTKFSDENTYQATVTYAGSAIYKNSKAVGVIKVSRVPTQLTTYDRSFSNDSSENYVISLKDLSGNALANQIISYTLNNQVFTQNSDANGQVKVNISSLSVGTYQLTANFAQTNQYKSSLSTSTINILNRSSVIFIDSGLPSDEIQTILDNADSPVEFLANTYEDISLKINKPLNITFQKNTVLNGKVNSPVLTINVDNFNITDLTINANEGSGIVVAADNVSLINNTISNNLDQSKSGKYDLGEIIIPGDGISLSNANNIRIVNNNIKSFGNAIFAKNSGEVEINNNTLALSNYGINYGLGVKNTLISNNLITKNIGLYVMDVPEGPLGYGIFLNQSAVNVSILYNNISDNYLGISVDSNYSTGIVIMYNLICDNALEGIRFNAGYDLAENAIEPNVNDNAIYRNAKGPSMMILGELSANPNGIYHYGEFNDTERLQLGANWFGKNARVTWDNVKNITGYGTMCPRINATYISIGNIETINPGNYSITFYKYSEVASSLPIFEMYVTLNDNVELKFNVINGVGTFSFNSSDFNSGSNIIKVSIGSLKDEYRTFEVLLNKTLQTEEIPV